MRDIADVVFEDSSPSPAAPPSPAPPSSSPLRPWGMWGGWTAFGIACAGAVAHAVTRMRSPSSSRPRTVATSRLERRHSTRGLRPVSGGWT
jgi:hypothetical protein